ncbi:MAG: hypothetical protein COV34_02280 [Candidatus Zambryskibacteria bacterium CG10_big_fil_rev_8_21_14_0_10_42_12]|uniref:Uncharacterized protein n=1 Tax=Candidatus Zambryskibacteria bacterium CG10_big_fil_rev_8_21_14_0_10_42_12 TaxID=1975115 RepID=A0A2H0QVV4_9BACT|nr:MAG: hypothetical protein COV34_02280 [Candidatus Zambryskibacteria bacterium CG10_big_fil_rev_8_21_14_0_10_42_12]
MLLNSLEASASRRNHVSAEIRKFWELIKPHLDVEGLQKVAEQYPELREQALQLTQPQAPFYDYTPKGVDAG